MFNLPNIIGIIKCSIPCRYYAMKSSLPVKWVRPEKIPCYDPKRSGDSAPLIDIDVKTEVPHEFRDSEELKTADPLIKRLFSLEFFPYSKTVEVLRHRYVDKVKRHELDYDSDEACVARMTADIRDMQKYLALFPRNLKAKVRLKETVDKRKRRLKNIRAVDYKRYEWLMEKLDLFFKPQPPYEVYLRVERKRTLRLLTERYCDDIKNKRLEQYRIHLKEQQKKHLEDKVEKLEYILKTEKEYNVENPSVTEEEIQKAKEQLEKWLKENPAKEE